MDPNLFVNSSDQSSDFSPNLYDDWHFDIPVTAITTASSPSSGGSQHQLPYRSSSSNTPPAPADSQFYQQAEPEKPFHSKRPHKKSRRGCINCKTRKVKCDEARPVCRSCHLRKVECVYAGPPPVASRDENGASAINRTNGMNGNHQNHYQTSNSPSQTSLTPPVNSLAPLSPATTSYSFSPTNSSTGSFDNSALMHMNAPKFAAQDWFLPANVSPAVIMEPLYVPSPDVEPDDLKLLWHYTANTFSGFTVHPCPQGKG